MALRIQLQDIYQALKDNVIPSPILNTVLFSEELEEIPLVLADYFPHLITGHIIDRYQTPIPILYHILETFPWQKFIEMYLSWYGIIDPGRKIYLSTLEQAALAYILIMSGNQKVLSQELLAYVLGLSKETLYGILRINFQSISYVDLLGLLCTGELVSQGYNPRRNKSQEEIFNINTFIMLWMENIESESYLNNPGNCETYFNRLNFNPQSSVDLPHPWLYTMWNMWLDYANNSNLRIDRMYISLPQRALLQSGNWSLRPNGALRYSEGGKYHEFSGLDFLTLLHIEGGRLNIQHPYRPRQNLNRWQVGTLKPLLNNNYVYPWVKYHTYVPIWLRYVEGYESGLLMDDRLGESDKFNFIQFPDREKVDGDGGGGNEVEQERFNQPNSSQSNEICVTQIPGVIPLHQISCSYLGHGDWRSFLNSEQGCSTYGERISKGLVHVAATKIFKVPEQSILELPVNSLDAYLRTDGRATVGRFGMGFFSILVWIYGYAGRRLYIRSQTKTCVTNLVIYYDGTLIMELCSDVIAMFNLPGIGEHIADGTTIYLDAEENPFQEDELIEFTLQLKKLKYSALKIKDGRDEGKILPYEVLLTIDPQHLLFMDGAGGISTDVLFTSLLSPAISSKSLNFSRPSEASPSDFELIYDPQSRYNLTITVNKIVVEENVFNVENEFDATFSLGGLVLHCPPYLNLPVSRDRVSLREYGREILALVDSFQFDLFQFDSFRYNLAWGALYSRLHAEGIAWEPRQDRFIMVSNGGLEYSNLWWQVQQVLGRTPASPILLPHGKFTYPQAERRLLEVLRAQGDALDLEAPYSNAEVLYLDIPTVTRASCVELLFVPKNLQGKYELIANTYLDGRLNFHSNDDHGSDNDLEVALQGCQIYTDYHIPIALQEVGRNYANLIAALRRNFGDNTIVDNYLAAQQQYYSSLLLPHSYNQLPIFSLPQLFPYYVREYIPSPRMGFPDYRGGEDTPLPAIIDEGYLTGLAFCVEYAPQTWDPYLSINSLRGDGTLPEEVFTYIIQHLPYLQGYHCACLLRMYWRYKKRGLNLTPNSNLFDLCRGLVDRMSTAYNTEYLITSVKQYYEYYRGVVIPTFLFLDNLVDSNSSPAYTPKIGGISPHLSFTGNNLLSYLYQANFVEDGSYSWLAEVGTFPSLPLQSIEIAVYRGTKPAVPTIVEELLSNALPSGKVQVNLSRINCNGPCVLLEVSNPGVLQEPNLIALLTPFLSTTGREGSGFHHIYQHVNKLDILTEKLEIVATPIKSEYGRVNDVLYQVRFKDEGDKLDDDKLSSSSITIRCYIPDPKQGVNSIITNFQAYLNDKYGNMRIPIYVNGRLISHPESELICKTGEVSVYKNAASSAQSIVNIDYKPYGIELDDNNKFLFHNVAYGIYVETTTAQPSELNLGLIMGVLHGYINGELAFPDLVLANTSTSGDHRDVLPGIYRDDNINTLLSNKSRFDLGNVVFDFPAHELSISINQAINVVARDNQLFNSDYETSINYRRREIQDDQLWNMIWDAVKKWYSNKSVVLNRFSGIEENNLTQEHDYPLAKEFITYLISHFWRIGRDLEERSVLMGTNFRRLKYEFGLDHPSFHLRRQQHGYVAVYSQGSIYADPVSNNLRGVEEELRNGDLPKELLFQNKNTSTWLVHELTHAWAGSEEGVHGDITFMLEGELIARPFEQAGIMIFNYILQQGLYDLLLVNII